MLQNLKSDMDNLARRICTLREFTYGAYLRQADKLEEKLKLEQSFRDCLKDWASKPDAADENVLKFIDQCEKEYGITANGFPWRGCDGTFALRPQVILMCVRLIRAAYFHAPYRTVRHQAPRVRKDADFYSYAMKHRLEDWFQYLYGYVDPHNGYVSNGEACIVAMYFAKYDSNIMKVGKIPDRCGRTPNIDISYSRELKHFFNEDPYFFKL